MSSPADWWYKQEYSYWFFFSCKHHFSGITQLVSHAMIYVVHSIITVYLSSQFSPLNTCTFVLILSCIHTFFGQAQKNDFHLSSLLLQESFLLQALGLLWWWGTWKTEEHFHWIVDEPLQSRQSTDHDDTWAETLPQTCGNKKKITTKITSTFFCIKKLSRDFIGSATHHSMIGRENSRPPPLDQSQAKPKLVQSRFPAFKLFTLSLWVLIGCLRHFSMFWLAFSIILVLA